jgi:hypothetical protein
MFQPENSSLEVCVSGLVTHLGLDCLLTRLSGRHDTSWPICPLGESSRLYLFWNFTQVFVKRPSLNFSGSQGYGFTSFL